MNILSLLFILLSAIEASPSARKVKVISINPCAAHANTRQRRFRYGNFRVGNNHKKQLLCRHMMKMRHLIVKRQQEMKNFKYLPEKPLVRNTVYICLSILIIA